MKIIVAGGTGFIGTALIQELVDSNHHVTLLTRNPHRIQRHSSGLVDVEQWDGVSVGAWALYIDGADAVINLTGESIGGKRWSSKQKEILTASRLNATNAIVEAIKRASKKPEVLISASAVGYYGNVDEGDVAEDYPAGGDFLATLCKRWEEAAMAANKAGVRVVTPRIGVVLERDGGALKKMLLPFSMFVGGPLGTGKQWFPWVHRDDVIGVFLFALSERKLLGPLNVAAPEYVNMKQFCAEFGDAMHRPSWAPVPSVVLRTILGEMSTIVLTGQKVIPRKLLNMNYQFKYPKLVPALQAVIQKE